MSTIYVGSARHDENGNISGGKAGDQKQSGSVPDTCGEVSVRAMYTHSKGWYILRAKKVDLADKIAERMTAACNNVNIGYDQSERTGINTYGIDTQTPTECDCSSLMRQVVKEASGTDPGNFTTENELDKLMATSLFDNKGGYTSQSKTPVYNGDILVTKSKGHTVAVVSGSVRSGSSRTEALEVDGSIGKLTVTRLQEVMGTTQDGFISGQSAGSKKYYEAFLSGVCMWNGGTSEVVRALQKKIGVTADGSLGVNTAKGLQNFLIGKGYSCGSTGADGYIGVNSAKALQLWLNQQ